MSSRTRPSWFAASATGLAGVALAVTALTIADAAETRPEQASPVLTYREADDPIETVLAAVNRQLGTEEGNNEEATTRCLRDLDRIIPSRPDYPRPHWYRGLTLSRLKRHSEARSARDEAIRLARLWPGGDDLLPGYYAAHASYCAEEGDPAAAAAAFLARLDLTPESPEQYSSLAETLREPLDRDPVAPGPGRNFADIERREALWGPLTHFFERYTGPTGPAALEQVAERVRAGMDYREVARKCGFPSIGAGDCPWDHGVPDMDACWRYQIEEPTIVHQGDFIGAIPPSNAVIVHVVISGHVVQKVERLLSSAPEDRPIRHGEQASFDFDSIIAGVAFSPDGSTVAAGDTKGVVHLWDVRGRRERSALRVPGAGDSASSRGWLHSVAFTPDGKTLAAAGLYDGTVRLWDVGTGRPGATLQVLPLARDNRGMDHVESLAFSPDGKTIATAGHGADVGLWDVATGRRVASLRGHFYKVQVVAFAPDGKTLASGDDEGMVRLWDVAAARPRGRLPGYAAAVNGLAFSRDGRFMAVGRSDGTEAMRGRHCAT